MRTLTLSLVAVMVTVGHAHAGIQANGIQANGIQANGIQANGVSYSGLSISSTQISYIGQSTSVFGYSCSHREDVTGVALDNCSACAMTVANADAYCRATAWDSLCVSEAKSTCTLGAGAVLTASFNNGTSAKMKIDSVQQGASSAWNGSVYMNMSDVFYNRLSWVLDHAPNVTGGRLLAGMNSCTNKVINLGGAGYAPDPYCGTASWDGECVAEANAECGTTAAASTVGDSVCGYTGGGTTAIQAVFVPGTFDTHWGAQGNGGRTSSSSSSLFTIACRGVGAIAKCVDFGYKPWLSSRNDQLHQSCVRMVRADYCGDGSSFTRDGQTINVEDANVITADADIQTVTTNPTNMAFDGAWTPAGAQLIGQRQSRSFMTMAYTNESLGTYRNSHPYCQPALTEWISGNWFAAHPQTNGVLITNTGTF